MKNRFTHIIYFFVGFIFTILFLELFLKFSEIKLPYKTIDEKAGKTYQSDVLIHETKEGFFMDKTNAYGFIGDTCKSNKKFRIALFGDSYTEGFQLFRKYHFSEILEQELNKKSAVQVEVFNFGMSNVVLPEMYIRKKALAEQFNIDLFVYVLDSYDFIFLPEGILNSVALTEVNHTLQVTSVPSKSFDFYKKVQPVIDNSSYLNFVFDAYLLIRRQQALPIILDKFYTTRPNYTYYQKTNSYDTFEYIPAQYFKIIQEIEKEPSVFVFREDVDTTLKSKLSNYKIPVIETKTVLDELRNEGINPYYWELTQTYGHLNHHGNQKMGVYLSEKLLPYVRSKK